MAGALEWPSGHERLRARALRILQPRFRFTSLPAEIRLQIYSCVLADAIDEKSPLPLALLRVSKQVFPEYRAFALEHIRLSFMRASDVHTYFQALDPGLIRHVKHIKTAWNADKDFDELHSIIGLPWNHLRSLTVAVQAHHFNAIRPFLNELCFQLRFVDKIDIVRIVPGEATRYPFLKSRTYASIDDKLSEALSDMVKRSWVRPQQDALQCCRWMRGFEVRKRDGRETLTYTLTRRAALKDLIEECDIATKIGAMQFKTNILPSLQWLERAGWWLIWDPSPAQIQFDVRVYE